MPESSPTPPTSTPVRRSRLAKADRPLYDALHVKPGADLRWQLRRDRGLSDAELRAAMAEEGPYDGLISDTTLARVRRVLKSPFPLTLQPHSHHPTRHRHLCSPSPLPPGAGRRTTRTTTPLTHPPPFLEIHRRVFMPPTQLGAELWAFLRRPRPSRRGPPPAPGHPLGAHRGPGERQPRLLPLRGVALPGLPSPLERPPLRPVEGDPHAHRVASRPCRSRLYRHRLSTIG